MEPICEACANCWKPIDPYRHPCICICGNNYTHLMGRISLKLTIALTPDKIKNLKRSFKLNFLTNKQYQHLRNMRLIHQINVAFKNQIDTKLVFDYDVETEKKYYMEFVKSQGFI